MSTSFYQTHDTQEIEPVPDIHVDHVPIHISAGTTAFRVPLITPIEASHLERPFLTYHLSCDDMIYTFHLCLIQYYRVLIIIINRYSISVARIWYLFKNYRKLYIYNFSRFLNLSYHIATNFLHFSSMFDQRTANINYIVKIGGKLVKD